MHKPFFLSLENKILENWMDEEQTESFTLYERGYKDGKILTLENGK